MSVLECFDASGIGMAQIATQTALSCAGCAIAVYSDVDVFSVRIDERISGSSIRIVTAFRWWRAAKLELGRRCSSFIMEYCD